MLLEQEVKEYIQLLNELYPEIEVAVGIDNTPLNIIKPKQYMNNLLYYADGILTDKHFIKNVVVSPSFEKNGQVYCRGDIAVGDYLTTCDMYGVAMKTSSKDTAFGIVKKIYELDDISDIQPQTIIRLVDVEFFK